MARSRATTPVAETLAAASRRNPRRVNAPDRLGFETPKATTTTKIAKATPKKTVAKKVTGVTKVSRPKAMPKSKVSAKKPSPTKKSSPSKKIPAGTRPAYGHLLSGGQDFVDPTMSQIRDPQTGSTYRTWQCEQSGKWFKQQVCPDSGNKLVSKEEMKDPMKPFPSPNLEKTNMTSEKPKPGYTTCPVTGDKYKIWICSQSGKMFKQKICPVSGNEIGEKFEICKKTGNPIPEKAVAPKPGRTTCPVTGDTYKIWNCGKTGKTFKQKVCPKTGKELADKFEICKKTGNPIPEKAVAPKPGRMTCSVTGDTYKIWNCGKTGKMFKQKICPKTGKELEDKSEICKVTGKPK